MEAAAQATDTSGWRAVLALGFDRRHGASKLVERRHEGPLVVQRPFYPEGKHIAHVYLLHPPGGVVGGDRLTTEVHVRGGANALLTTPAATKLYRSAGATCHIEQRLVVEEGALEWIPGETIVFDGARARLTTVVELAESARFIGWEMSVLGRRAGERPFVDGHFKQHIRVSRSQVPLLSERSSVRSIFADDVLGRRQHDAYGTLIATARIDALSLCRQAVARSAADAGATHIDGLLVLRALGQLRQVRALFEDVWAQLRPHVVGAEGVQPRIWRT